MGATEFWEPLHTAQIMSLAGGQAINLFLISDGHVTQESLVVMETRKSTEKIRLFTLGVR